MSSKNTNTVTLMDGENSLEYRKLQVTGGSTFIVSLPRKWITDHGLTQSDVVGVEYLGTGEIQITPNEIKKMKKKAIIDLKKYPSSSLYDYLIGVYVSGCDIIEIKQKGGLGTRERRLIRRFLRDTRGMEISSDNNDKLEIISLLNPNELPLQVSLNRMYLLVTSLANDTLAVIKGEDLDSISDFEDRERQIDARRLLVDRQVAMALNSPKIERTLGVNRLQAMEHASMARALERMGDHAYVLASLVFENEGKIELDPDSLPLSLLPMWSSALSTIIRNTYSKEITLLVEAKEALHAAIEDLEAHENDLMDSSGKAKNVILEFRISEIIRRLCGYSIDSAETLINMLMSSRMENVDK